MIYYFDDDEVNNSKNDVDYIIKRKEPNKMFLASFDHGDTNVCMWCSKKMNAFVFSRYEEAKRTLDWLASLKIKAEIDTL